MKLFSKDLKGYTDEVNFDIKSLSEGHHKSLYKNIPMIKCPFDYLIYQMIVFELRPDLIIEIGTNIGGSSVYLADLLELAGKGEVHTIDIVDVRDENAKNHKRVKYFGEGFQNYDLKNTNRFDNILVIEDGSHYYEDVKECLTKFQSLIKVGSYFIVEDGILDKLGLTHVYNGGPNKAIKEFILKNNSFIIDRRWCDLFGINATFNTNGYLKRIK